MCAITKFLPRMVGHSRHVGGAEIKILCVKPESNSGHDPHIFATETTASTDIAPLKDQTKLQDNIAIRRDSAPSGNHALGIRCYDQTGTIDCKVHCTRSEDFSKRADADAAPPVVSLVGAADSVSEDPHASQPPASSNLVVLVLIGVFGGLVLVAAPAVTVYLTLRHHRQRVMQRNAYRIDLLADRDLHPYGGKDDIEPLSFASSSESFIPKERIGPVTLPFQAGGYGHSNRSRDLSEGPYITQLNLHAASSGEMSASIEPERGFDARAPAPGLPPPRPNRRSVVVGEEARLEGPENAMARAARQWQRVAERQAVEGTDDVHPAAITLGVASAAVSPVGDGRNSFDAPRLQLIESKETIRWA
ncbi:uncharacterized protein BXZ73DRAFT_74221 [Epithele typhae]|uniref:uncharacterized protein n=1 Tax=Epithele typhae TaxID=378194 RepID=UPI002008C094|nr:uncharacterized protein BXZ73DRAFT_74221 [Epithele typhae]KAH9943212.1 hypothetical protein BXZ73DRAFT_74221 [Epithele typhae]